MPREADRQLANRAAGWLRRLAADQRGNTFVIVAASIVPMLALVGGAVDMSRGYLTRTRLQQACDAGVLATRKKLGSTVVTNGRIATDANTIGTRFFNVNFLDGAYGSTNRTFAMTLGSDYTINGTASAIVPTTVMYLFGVANIPVTVQCSSQFNYANTDIMMVLDTTGSMKEVNSGDTKSRISVLRDTVKDFYARVDENRTQGVRIRYGFVPYATNVNVGYLLKSGWMVNQNNYDGRRAVNVSSNWWTSDWRWRYESSSVNVSGLKGASPDALYKGGVISVTGGGTPSVPLNVLVNYDGCIEERGTYAITDYSNVDLARARDLDIDAIPDPTNPDTQWRPLLDDAVWLRALTLNVNANGSFSISGSWSRDSLDRTNNYSQPSAAGLAACPSGARKLAEMSASQVATYVDSLVVAGSTYHDIGMIWGGRLISPTGLFASENAEVNGRPTMRHLIFLTDGETSALEYSYGSYGVEPLSRRRCTNCTSAGITEQVENRFAFACEQVKNRNVTVWVIGFGTTMNDLMKDCAGSGHWFQADNATQLSSAFATIAAAIGDLRIVK